MGFLDLLKNLPFKKIIQMFSGQCMRKYNILSDIYIYIFLIVTFASRFSIFKYICLFVVDLFSFVCLFFLAVVVL